MAKVQYDVAGNIGEWTLDPYVEDAYASASTRNPVANNLSIDEIIATANTVVDRRVIRGGSHQDYDNLMRVANRSQHPPRLADVAGRVVHRGDAKIKKTGSQRSQPNNSKRGCG